MDMIITDEIADKIRSKRDIYILLHDKRKFCHPMLIS